jgi:hypothetical protein
MRITKGIIGTEDHLPDNRHFVPDVRHARILPTGGPAFPFLVPVRRPLPQALLQAFR